MKQKVEVIPFLSHMGEFCSPLKPNSESLLIVLLIGWRQKRPPRGGGAAASLSAIKSSATGVAGSFINTAIVHCANCRLTKTQAHTPTCTISRQAFSILLVPSYSFPPQRDWHDVHLSSKPQADLTFLDTVSSRSTGMSLPNPNTACRKVEEEEGPEMLTLETWQECIMNPHSFNTSLLTSSGDLKVSLAIVLG